MSNYKMLNDEDIIGKDDLDEEDHLQEGAEAKDVPDKWKKLETDLKQIREREAQRDEIATLRQTLEQVGDGAEAKDSTNILSKRE